MRYQGIVFMQGDEAAGALDHLERYGEEAAIDFLAEWDFGNGEVRDHTSVGEHDDLYETDDGMRLSYNTRLGYIGLERAIAGGGE